MTSSNSEECVVTRLMRGPKVPRKGPLKNVTIKPVEAPTKSHKATALLEKLNKLRPSDESPFEKYGELSLERLDTFSFMRGKYEGREFKDVFDNETGYIKWLIANEDVLSPRSNAYLFYQYVLRKLET